MAFAPKIDFSGLVEKTKVETTPILAIRDHQLNGSEEKYQPTGQDGSFVGTEIYGEDRAPSNTFGLKAKMTAAAGAVKLNSVTSINHGTTDAPDVHNYALASFKIETGGGSPVKISTTTKEIEAGTTGDANQCLYWLPAFVVDTKQHAQDVFGAFTLTGEGCELTKCDAEGKCNVNPDKVEGVKISSDCNSGVVTVSGTVLSRSGVVPTIAAKSESVSLGNSQTATWKMTKNPKPTENNGESVYKQFTFELELCLKKAPEAQANGGQDNGAQNAGGES